ncbi:sigma factor-like helix-turn-helix DNA-binding protein [Polyangium sp. 6x1]|uniref:sigma factor-like helix-turn-helix DNA-binding protein n=1 Tax=Polyangium sp. 6x1 TaxID=3042689 RepID=UPI002482BD08|nr:sigma factor-like helix-turn-helix DNA-binding protein [Polyangium sp. 6x1]MDI1442434.1 hypothetical protein [Polyangium sp. 6x1]
MSSALRETAARMLREGHAQWPGVAVDHARFEPFLAAKLADGADPSALYGADLVLACACLAGDPAAVAHFTRVYVPDLRAALGYLRNSGGVIDDTVQQVLELLFAGASPHVATYAGRGPLRGWVRAIGVRIAARSARAAGAPAAAADELVAVPDVGDDPELRHLKALYRPTFQRAFHDALAALPARARTLLGQRYLDGLNIDELAALYRVHRATCARWLADARDELFTGTRKRLLAALGASPDDVDSILRLVQSDVDLSLRRILAASPL